ncbi:PREDICTED: telomerase reverse transcriptase isoform X3 [Nicotiana attenuata]|uniref:telomerase reverse transcriptase isoform X3 n=1 Tax=Nicotiana attenuata TaxID=49451 RepID=UPI0009052ACB|nr:PREDICTED: telomerase reverse transcriptase isoform X3 [Nicotiana attenuata]
MSTKRRRVPPVLWRLFHNRARTLGDTILSLVPSKTSANCLCKGRQCLGCVGENGATSFLIREKDPDNYRKLLNKCFVVLSDSTPPLRVYDPHCRWSHLELVRRTIEMTIIEQPSNVICFGYDKMSRFSDIVELLTSPAWGLLLKRIGDVLMVHLLKNTSIFFRLPRNKHRQVAGVPICDLRRKSLLHVSATTYKLSLLHPESRKKRSVDEVYSSMRKKMCIRKNCAAEKLSTETTKSACSDVLPSREGQFYSITHTSLCGKRKRQYKWERQRKRKQLKAQEKYSLIPCMNSNTKDNWPGDQNCDVSSNSMLLLEKKNTWCSCCLVFQTIPEVKKEVQISRQTIFYKLESFPSVFPSKHILNSLKPDASGANRLFKEIFGSLGVNVTTQIASCTHSSNCTFIRSTCLYHSIIKLLKTLIRKAHHCQHVRLLEKHCSTQSLDQCSKSIIATILEVQGRKVRKEQLQNDLKEHIKRNVLRLGSNFFVQSVGIPQGSVLSSMLCSLYLGHLEKSVIFPFLDKACEPAPGFPSEECFLDDTASGCAHLLMCKPSYLLLRFIDDLLFISTSKEQASRFFSRLQRGFRAYNCDMNKKKFGMNFQINTIPDPRSDRLYVVEDGTSFLRWSGLFINCSTLEIQADYTRYLNFPLSSTLTVCWLNKPGRDLKVKLCGYLRPKCHPIFYDSNINSAAVVRLNIYQAFLLCAMKFHCYVFDLSSICRFSTKFYADALGKSLRYMKKLIKRRMFSFKTGSDFRPILEVGKGEIEWLGLTAYIRVLKRKQSRYKELLRVLDSKLMALGKQESTLSVLQEATDDKRSSILWKIKY